MAQVVCSTETAIQPTFSFAGQRANQNQPYVVTMFDLDAPNPQDPSLSPIRHFLGSDFYAFTPREYDYALLANTSEAMSFYVQPAPTAGSAPHRQVFLNTFRFRHSNNECGDLFIVTFGLSGTSPLASTTSHTFLIFIPCRTLTF